LEELKHLGNMIGDNQGYVLFYNINMYNDALAFDRLLEERIK